jgi:hypothetical protein
MPLAVDMASGAAVYTPSFIKIRPGIPREGGRIHIKRQTAR